MGGQLSGSSRLVYEDRIEDFGPLVGLHATTEQERKHELAMKRRASLMADGWSKDAIRNGTQEAWQAAQERWGEIKSSSSSPDRIHHDKPKFTPWWQGGPPTFAERNR